MSERKKKVTFNLFKSSRKSSESSALSSENSTPSSEISTPPSENSTPSSEISTPPSENFINTQKPPLPPPVTSTTSNKKKRKRRFSSSSVLSTITNSPSLTSFCKKKSRLNEMGLICPKCSGSDVNSPNHTSNHHFTPSKKCSRNVVSPSHEFDVKDSSCNGSVVNDSAVLFYRSDITIDPVSNIDTNHKGDDTIHIKDIDPPDDKIKDNEKSNSETVKLIVKTDNDVENEMEDFDEVFEDADIECVVSSAQLKSVESVTTNSTTALSHIDGAIIDNMSEQIVTNKQKSLPDLRSSDSSIKRLKRLSQGDALKSSMGSTNLLEIKKSFVQKQIKAKRKTSENENKMNIERRRKRLPTVENRINILEEGQVNCYEVLEELGRGSFGAVCKCKSHKDNNFYAMKMISKKRLMRKNRQLSRRPGSQLDPLEPLYREVAILKKLDHPNVVKLFEVIDDIQVDNFYMIFELMSYGVVIDIPTENVIPEERSRQLFRELVLGVEYLHYTKIIHRDIKPSNLLLDSNSHLKIADFGVSNMFKGDDDLLNKYAGSPAFQAPEVLNYDSRDKYSGKAVDIWAMGITLYCFLYGQCPFFSNNIGELSDMIKNDLVSFPDEPILNPQVFDLISRMLSKEAKNRITMEEIKEHPWVTEGGNYTLPTTEENCTFIEVTEEEVRNSIKTFSKLSSLVVVKSILKGKSFLKGKPLKN